jgi:F0F1-type ATP synthase assembly protein I
MPENGDNKDDRNFIAALFEWSARTSAIAFGAVVPALIGLGIDIFFGTLPMGVVFGAVIGCIAAFLQLLALTRNVRK